MSLRQRAQVQKVLSALTRAHRAFTSAAFSTLRPRSWRDSSRCPYCPADAPPHWIGWGSYRRYACDCKDPSRRVAIPRNLCKIVGRTFSSLPDSLLPYCCVRTVSVLACLHALFVGRVGLDTLARQVGVGRGALRSMKARFLRALPKLRLPRREGALAPAAFLEVLAGMGPAAVGDLFQPWKEREPKHSIVGIYLRC